MSSCWDHHYIAPRICSGSVKCQVRAFRGSPNPKLQTLIRREYEQKVCFEAAKTVGKAKTKQNETLLGSSFSRFFLFFLQLAVNRVQDRPQLLTLFMARSELRKQRAPVIV